LARTDFTLDGTHHEESIREASWSAVAAATAFRLCAIRERGQAQKHASLFRDGDANELLLWIDRKAVAAATALKALRAATTGDSSLSGWKTHLIDPPKCLL